MRKPERVSAGRRVRQLGERLLQSVALPGGGGDNEAAGLARPREPQKTQFPIH